MRYTTLFLLLCAASTFVSAQTFQFYDSPQQTRQSSAPTTATKGAEASSGYAIYYADYLDNRPTSLGEIYYKDQMTASHRSYPLGTLVKVTRVDNNKSVVVRVNDRGAYCDDCAIDLSWIAAQQLDILRLGRVRVHVQVVGQSNTNPPVPGKAAGNETFTARGVSPSQTQQQPSGYGYDQSYSSVPTSYEASSNTPNFTAKGVRAAAPSTYNPPPAYNSPTYNSPAPAASTQTAVTARSATPSRNPNEVMVLANQTSGYCVQLGSYREYSNAQRHIVGLQNRGIDNAYLKQEQHPAGGILYKVVIAAFPTMNDAQLHLQDLRSRMSMEGVVIPLK